MRIVRTRHFSDEQHADDISDDEVAEAWARPQLTRPSTDHPGAEVRRATMPDGSQVTVVARQTSTDLIFSTTWRNT